MAKELANPVHNKRGTYLAASLLLDLRAARTLAPASRASETVHTAANIELFLLK
jgi:hypothetical protein